MKLDLNNLEIGYKKSAVDLTDLAVGLVVLGIVVTIGSLIIVNLRDNTLTDLSVVTTGNETLAVTSPTSAVLTNTWGKSVVTVTNATGGEVINSANYTATVSSLDGSITLSNATASYAKPWNVTYQWYNTSQADWTLANNASNGLLEFGNWFDIIVIVGVASVVLALIFMAFGNRNQGSVAAAY